MSKSKQDQPSTITPPPLFQAGDSISCVILTDGLAERDIFRVESVRGDGDDMELAIRLKPDMEPVFHPAWRFRKLEDEPPKLPVKKPAS
jgi:hypothetical protein